MMKEGSAISAGDVSSAGNRVRGLRANCLAAVVILLVEYGLGIWVNLYGHLSASDHGANMAHQSGSFPSCCSRYRQKRPPSTERTRVKSSAMPASQPPRCSGFG
ncbi:MAG TPA: hypothetical protein VIY52_27690 [Streptosporangiaceae bacterium]